MNIWQLLTSNQFIGTCLSLSIPILFASLAALVSNKAGILNINIEGSMSVSALMGALASFYIKSWAVGALCGVASGILMGMLLYYCAHNLKTNSVLSGVALNIFATGLCVFVMQALLGSKGNTEAAPSTRIPDISIPFLKDIPLLGAVFEQSVLFYLAVLSVVVVDVLLKRTKLGLRIRAVGYNPQASLSVGISVKKTQFTALVIAGVFAGLGGVYMSMAYLGTFNSGMIAGRGFIGLAAEAMGSGIPYLTMLFTFIFGIVTAFSISAQTALNVPYELLNTLPYLMTVIALVIFSVRNKKRIQKRKDKDDEKSMA